MVTTIILSGLVRKFDRNMPCSVNAADQRVLDVGTGECGWLTLYRQSSDQLPGTNDNLQTRFLAGVYFEMLDVLVNVVKYDN